MIVLEQRIKLEVNDPRSFKRYLSSGEYDLENLGLHARGFET